MNRTINLTLTGEDIMQIAGAIGTMPCDTDLVAVYADRDQLWHAIGYLSTWNMTFPKVTIYKDGDTDLIAVYADSEGNTKYVIGAVWHGEHYGFHS